MFYQSMFYHMSDPKQQWKPNLSFTRQKMGHLIRNPLLPWHQTYMKMLYFDLSYNVVLILQP